MEYTEIILNLVKIQVQFRFMHWQTTSFSQHKAYGEIYESLDENIDTFVEACMGKHGRPKYIGGYQINGMDAKEMDLQSFIDETCNFLISLTDHFDSKKDSDLLNLRDEMLQGINKLKYLLTLK